MFDHVLESFYEDDSPTIKDKRSSDKSNKVFY